MAKRIIFTFWLLASLFLLTISMLVYRQVFSVNLAAHPGNHRALLAEYSIQRGSIFTADGAVLAESIASGDVFNRHYPLGEQAADITGYWNPIRGRSGLEQSYDRTLVGDETFAGIDDWFSSLVNHHHRGNDVTLTIDSRLQQAAWQALGDRRGAVVALEPKTGAVLAMVSRPSYDPNRIVADWAGIAGDASGPLLNRATQGKYPPGSTFKIITASGAIARGQTTADTVYDGPAALPVDGSTVRNFADEESGRLPLGSAFALSTNTIFAQVGLKLGASNLVETATGFGLNQPLKFDLPTAMSTIPSAKEMDQVLLAWSAVGQGKTLVTPLQMALVSATIADGGKVPEPYLVKTIRDYKGTLIKKTEPRTLRRATDASTAKTIKEMMIEVVEKGTAKKIKSSNLQIAGKTGTAEIGPGLPSHAWFVAFAPADNPKIAIAVLVEKGGLGGQTAAPIARAVIDAASRNW